MHFGFDPPGFGHSIGIPEKYRLVTEIKLEAADTRLQEGIPFKRGKLSVSAPCPSIAYRHRKTDPFLRGIQSE